jgi:uncharacterized RDD family membrane protein YckC
MADQSNPYRAPVSVLGASVVATAVDAGKGRRFCTMLADTGAQCLITLLGFVALSLVLGPEALERSSQLTQMLGSLGASFAYYAFFEATWGRTPGKWICGTVVIDENGGTPSLGQVLGRTAARFVPFEAFSLLLSADEEPRGWHDRWSKTRVVRVVRAVEA